MKRCLLTALCTLIVLPVFCQTAPDHLRQEKIEQLISAADAEIRFHREVDHVKFIRFNDANNFNLKGTSAVEISESFMREYGTVYGDIDMLSGMELERISMDEIGCTHVKYRQIYNRVPVFDAEPIFHFNNQLKLTAISGNYVPALNISSVPYLTEVEAQKRAEGHVRVLHPEAGRLKMIKAELFIFNPGMIRGQSRNNYLCYYIELRDDQNIREYIFIDAHTGKIVERYNGICTAIHREIYENTSSNLVWEEGDSYPGSLTDWQQNEVDFSGQTYNFFKNAFDYISYDNNDAMMKTINNASFLGCPNASWNGSTANYCDGTATDDVIGHEWGHAYTEYTNDLIYAWQSGALNESYSDIWGETIDQLNSSETENNDSGEDNGPRTGCDADKDLWKMGEQANGFSSPPIRDMWMPSCKSDPNEVSASEYQCGSGDSGGVHSNSGVPNHLYALLVDGGTYNGQTINAIGMTKAAHIFWRVQSQYLGRTSDFETLADALESACEDLRSAGTDLEGLSVTDTPAGPSGEIITAADCAELDKAILAVELAEDPSQCSFTAMLAGNADVCSDEDPEGIFFVEDWESGSDGWTMTQLPSNSDTWESRDWYLNSDLPDGRTGQGITADNPANGNCNDDLENGIVRLESPVISVPNTAEDPVELIFDHFVSLENRWDGGNVKYSVNDGDWSIIPTSAFIVNGYPDELNGGSNDNPLAGESAFTGADGGSVGGSWGQSQVDLSELNIGAGDSFKLRFELGSDGCNGWDGWYIDDVSVYACALMLLPVELVSFNASVENRSVELRWETASELNSDFFDLERRSSDEVFFTRVGKINASGTRSELSSYNHRDFDVILGETYFYRLKQVDLNGAYVYSSIISAELSTPVDYFQIAPNPVLDALELYFNSSEARSVLIYDTSGKIVYNGESSGLHSRIDLDFLAPGVYTLKAESSIGSTALRLIKH